MHLDDPDTARRAGHRGVPHTADLRVEAWAPTREECLREAVLGVTESFVDVSGISGVPGASGTVVREATVRGERDEALLTGLLEEVVYRLDTEGEVPVAVEASPLPGGLRAVLSMADVGTLPVIGAAPKAVTLHELSFRGGPGGWTCSVTLDV